MKHLDISHISASNVLIVSAVALAAAMPSYAAEDTDDNTVSSVEDLKGIDLNVNTFKKYITAGRPQDDPSKVFVIYNVGQKKFLSLGGYYGTHATLSTIPHLFWLQRRNENKEWLEDVPKRYPSDLSTTILNEVLQMTNVQVGNIQSEKNGIYSHATYNYVRLVDNDGANTKELCATGHTGRFSNTDVDIDFLKQHIEASVDLSNCSGDNESILSVGKDISEWDPAINDIHIYYTKSNSTITIQYLSSRYNDSEYKKYAYGVNGTTSIRIGAEGVSVNGKIILATGYDAERAGDIMYDDKGNTTTTNITDYLYANSTKDKQTYFIASRFTKESPSANEGPFMARTKYDSSADLYGAIGLFGDRSVNSSVIQEGQWSIEPVEGKTNIYTFSLTFTAGHEYYTQEIDATQDNGYKSTAVTPTEDTQMFMQATKDYVKSSNLKVNKGNYYNDPDGTLIKDLTGVELLTDMPTNKEDAYWKIISMEEYYKLLANKSSEMAGKEVDFTFVVGDPNFEKEHGSLSKWKTEGLEEGTLKIGMDKYYKTSTDQTGYTNGYENPTVLNRVLTNHGRALGVMIYNGGRGCFYQDVNIYHPGWYTVQCAGMTNAGAKLFVQKVNGNEVSKPISTTLATITDEDINRYNTAGGTGSSLGWPYSYGLPMYNAIIEMNDKNINDGKYVNRFTNKVRIYIGEATETSPATLRFGVEVAEAANIVPLLAPNNGNAPRKADTTNSEMTVFDNFHLHFLGQDMQPELVLSEDFTDLDYIEKAPYTYDLQPLHLQRTFSKGEDGNNWNTIVLPVALTESQVKQAFGESTKLAKLYGITDNSIRFVYETANADGVLLRAFTPYLIKPDNTQGSNKEYKVSLKLNDDTSATPKADANHFLISSATLAGKQLKDGSTTEYEYPFSTKYEGYEVTAESETTDATLGTMTAHGTLCKTYETAGTILKDRPTLKSGNCYIMKNNVMYKVPVMEKGYGLKGFRCWFEYTAPESGDATDPTNMKININGIEDDATNIDDIAAADGIATIKKYHSGIYSLNGKKISNGCDITSLPKGIYIVNGKKFIK